MTPREVVEATLLVVGVAEMLASCVGVAVAGNALARLHLLSAVGTLGPAAIGAAVVVRDGFGPLGIKAILIVGMLWISGPVLAHAIGRAAWRQSESSGAKA